MKSLTIEELKALEVGDWVWIVEKFFDRQYKGYVTLFDYTPQSNNIFFLWQDRARHYMFTDYGKTWLAYKNKEQAEAKGEIVELPCIREVFKKNKPTYRVFFLRDDNFIDSYAEWTEEEAERHLAELRGEKK